MEVISALRLDSSGTSGGRGSAGQLVLERVIHRAQARDLQRRNGVRIGLVPALRSAEQWCALSP